MTIRVLIADDQDIIRTGLATILGSQPDIDVIGQAADGREWSLSPAVYARTCASSTSGCRTSTASRPPASSPAPTYRSPAVVVITTFDTDAYISGALKAGAKGFLLKDAGPDLLLQAIRAAAEGDALIVPSVTIRLLASFAENSNPSNPTQPLATSPDTRKRSS